MKNQAERKNREIDGRWLRSGMAEQVLIGNIRNNRIGLSGCEGFAHYSEEC